MDPLAESFVDMSPYNYVSNSVTDRIDPDGKKELPCYNGYMQGSLGAFKIRTCLQSNNPEDWTYDDRMNNTVRWQNANLYNLENQRHWEYQTIEQRAAFYGWFDSYTARLGFETRWAKAASKVAGSISFLSDEYEGYEAGALLGYSSADASQFAKTGNRVIFENVFPKLKNLIKGTVLKGRDAKRWDGFTLAQEQSLIQPLYENTKAFGLVSAASKQGLAGMSIIAPILVPGMAPFPASGNLMNVKERWAYGMQAMGHKVAPHQMPYPGGEYASGMILRNYMIKRH